MSTKADAGRIRDTSVARVIHSTVVLVTWRSHELIGPCVDALAAQRRPHRVPVVDNVSTDGTVAVLAGHPARSTVLQLGNGWAAILASPVGSL